MHLTVDDERIEDAPGVIAGDQALQMHVTGLGVDLDHRDMGAEGERGSAGGEVGEREQGGVGVESGGDVRPSEVHGGSTGHVEPGGCGVEHDVGHIGLEQVGGPLARQIDELRRRVEHRRAGHLQ